MTEPLRIPGLVCPCGNADLVAVQPGDEGDGCDLFTLRRPVPSRGFCCLAHAVLYARPDEARLVSEDTDRRRL